MLYSDPAFTAEKLIFDSGTAADLEITDEYQVVHRVWKLTDPHLINLIITAMADKKLIIADGHHRYETSVTYMKERKAELNLGAPGLASETWDRTTPENEESPSNRTDEPHALLPKPAFPEAAMMMTFVNMDAPGITILPTHRVVFGLKPSFGESEWSPLGLFVGAESLFEIDHLPGPERDTQADLKLLNETPGTAFLAVTREGTKLMTAKPDAIKQLLAHTHPEISARQASLDVVQLHNVLLEHQLGLTHESIANTENIRYLRSAEEAVAQVHEGKADIAFLIKPVTLQQLNDISLSGDVMPQKSTDFYPKLLSGLAIYALD